MFGFAKTLSTRSIFAASAVLGAGGWTVSNKWATCKETKKGWSLQNNNIADRPDLPTFPLEEVLSHHEQDSAWVTFKGGVYDITPFMMGHPGGQGRLLMAAGRDLQPFWDVYRLHYRGHIIGFLEKYRIGNLSDKDAAKAKNFIFGDPFEDDPPRHPVCVGATHKPFCGEARTDLMTKSYITPNELFYVRNHCNVPDVDPEEYELTVDGHGIKPHTFTLHDLKTKFPKVQIVSTVQCAGNRVEDYHGIGKGVSKAAFMSPHWSIGAISNAQWGGARIRDILRYCGMDINSLALNQSYNANYHHLEFEALDHDETGGNYHASCPFDKIVDPNGDALVAYEMNGRPLPRDHGYPARAIVPGHAGARQPKWLQRMTVRDKAWPVFQCLNFAPDVSFEDHLADWPPKDPETVSANGLMRNGFQENVVREMPVQSLVCEPPQNAVIGAAGGLDAITLKGVAWSGGGMGIKRVDVTVDGGKNFTATNLYKPVVQHPRGQWGWTQFHKDVTLSEEIKAQLARGEKVTLQLASKAVDGHYNVQPEFPDAYVNPRGTAVNHWYRVAVTLDPSKPAGYLKNPMEEDNRKGVFPNRPSGGSFRVPFNEAGWGNVAPNEGWADWHKISNAENVKNEPGIEAEIDWDYYRNIRIAPWYEQPQYYYPGAHSAH